MKWQLTVSIAFMLGFVKLSSCSDIGGPPPPILPDTTSHNIAWQIDTIGNAQGYFEDVAIINDTLAYAVGAVYLLDSTGQQENDAHNLARWDGARWTLLQVFLHTGCGDAKLYPYPTVSILAFSPSDVWIANGHELIHWDGIRQGASYCIDFPTPAINKIWGRSGNSIFAVGDLGLFKHFDGNGWSTIPSGTDIRFVDVYGTSDANVWIAGLSGDYGWSALYHYDGASLRKVYEYNYPGHPFRPDSLTSLTNSVWVPEARVAWVLSDEIYQVDIASHGEAQLIWRMPSPIGFTRMIRGSARNNVFVVGDLGTIFHFNGSTWHHYGELMDLSSSIIILSLGVTRGQVFIVGASPAAGSFGGVAIIYRGRSY